MRKSLLLSLFILLAAAATAQVSRADVNTYMSGLQLQPKDIVKVQEGSALMMILQVDDNYSFELLEQGFKLKGYHVSHGNRTAYVPFQSLSFIEFQPSSAASMGNTLIFHLR
jgi:hypothetical protein